MARRQNIVRIESNRNYQLHSKIQYRIKRKQIRLHSIWTMTLLAGMHRKRLLTSDKVILM
jgi:hypothetical protein